MAKISSSVVASTIAIILLLVITGQASLIGQDVFCVGPCTDNCEQQCASQGYTNGFCETFRGNRICCCAPPKKQIFEQPAQLLN
ncbi:unnamed protein product [Microthlaspi erraticum]|uniref:Knottin scorpion toxin-like domain-containing protein n=1 Tax=Microthlaspi erraticum TaxID=1685480 RepID=A0A6D2I5P3_9BRAS|nr:unnamed protein product [Microthlaspi erraticum]